MGLKFGDAVKYVKKLPDGTVSRVNAIVLRSQMLAPHGNDRKPLKSADGKPLPIEEHVDLAFPVLSLAPGGRMLSTNNMDEIFRPAYSVRPWKEEHWSGFEVAEPEPEPSTEPEPESKPVVEAQGSGSERYAAGADFSGEGDPNGIAEEYTAQSLHVVDKSVTQEPAGADSQAPTADGLAQSDAQDQSASAE